MTVGVLLMAYGTPRGPEDIEAYYTHIRRGRPPTPELLADLERRYRAIGGVSPLLAITRAQAAGVQQALGADFQVELGMKHAPPFIEEGVAALAEHGVDAVVGLVLAPHYSTASVGEYVERARAALDDGPPMTFVESWHVEPGYVELLAGAVGAVQGGPQPSTTVFTAHSLPSRVIAAGDPYAEQLRETATAVAARAGVERWTVAWQSAGRTEEPWLGPTLLDVIAERAAAGDRTVIVCPAGFVSDHLEVLYDIDVEARAAAERSGIVLARTAMPNADAAFCEVLASVVRAHVDG